MGWSSRCAVVVALLGALAGCSSDAPTTRPPATAPAAASPSSSRVPTLTPLPQPPEPPASGEVLADLRQSSRDAAAGRMEVWLDNDTLGDLTPVEIRYVDPRFREPVAGDRLRLVPSRSERGFPLYLPDRPSCGRARAIGEKDGKVAGSGRVEVTYDDGSTATLDVDDSVDIVARFTAMRCGELTVARVATLAWADTVVDGPVAPGEAATLTLVVTPSGRPADARRRLRIDTVTGTPVLSADGAPYWTVDRTVAGDDDAETRIPLPLKPTRCDPHAFLESGGATAFRVTLHLDGRPVQLVLRMSTAGAAAAIDYAQKSCGF